MTLPGSRYWTQSTGSSTLSTVAARSTIENRVSTAGGLSIVGRSAPPVAYSNVPHVGHRYASRARSDDQACTRCTVAPQPGQEPSVFVSPPRIIAGYVIALTTPWDHGARKKLSGQVIETTRVPLVSGSTYPLSRARDGGLACQPGKQHPSRRHA